jgi:hypothetical protein
MYRMPIPAQNTPSATTVSLGDTSQLNDDLRALLTATPLDSVTQPPVIDHTLAQAVPAAVVESTDTLNPPHAVGGSLKETKELSFKVEKPAVDTVPGVQYVEQEVNQEVSPEVEAYLQRVNENQHQLPDEVVVADDTASNPTGHYVAQPVIVLPITPDVEKKGAHQSSQFSVRWLVEWSRKIMKMFSGKVVYRQV